MLFLYDATGIDMKKIYQRSEEFGNESIYRLLIRYSIPAAIGVFAFIGYNIVDRVFVGRQVGALALSGLSITFPVLIAFAAIGALVGVGGGTLISLRLGERKHKEAENILGNIISMFTIGGVVVGAFGLIFLKPILLSFGATETTLPYASSYLGLLLWFLPADFIAMGANGSLRAEGNPRISMYILLIGAVINIVLDYIFIFPLDMGVAGAALATVISKVVSSIWVLLHFRRGRSRALTLYFRNLRLRWNLIRPIMTIGFSPFSIQIFASIVLVALNHQLLHYSGEVAVGVMGAIFSIMLLLNIPVWGMIQGSQPILGYNYGAKNYKRVNQVLYVSLLCSVGIGLVGVFICLVAPAFLIRLFCDNDPSFVEIGSHGIRLFLCRIPINNFNMTGIQFFQAIGCPKQSVFLSFIKNIVCLLPTLFLLPLLLGLDGVWLAYPCCDLIALIFISTALYRQCVAKKYSSHNSKHV